MDTNNQPAKKQEPIEQVLVQFCTELEKSTQLLHDSISVLAERMDKMETSLASLQTKATAASGEGNPSPGLDSVKQQVHSATQQLDSLQQQMALLRRYCVSSSESPNWLPGWEQKLQVLCERLTEQRDSYEKAVGAYNAMQQACTDLLAEHKKLKSQVEQLTVALSSSPK